MATAQGVPRWPSSPLRPPLTTTVPHNLLQKAQWPLQIIDLLLGSTGMYILVPCLQILSIFLGRSYRPEFTTCAALVRSGLRGTADHHSKLSSEATGSEFAERNVIRSPHGSKFGTSLGRNPHLDGGRQTRLLPLHRSWWGPRNTAAAFSLSAQIGKDELRAQRAERGTHISSSPAWPIADGAARISHDCKIQIIALQNRMQREYEAIWPDD